MCSICRVLRTVNEGIASFIFVAFVISLLLPVSLAVSRSHDERATSFEEFIDKLVYFEISKKAAL